MIAVQPYYKVERTLTAGRQETIVHQRQLTLSSDAIVSEYRHFPLHEVFDISFRKMGDSQGVLYLHTKRGIYPYTIDALAADFMEEVKKNIAQNQ